MINHHLILLISNKYFFHDYIYIDNHAINIIMQYYSLIIINYNIKLNKYKNY